MTYCPGKPSRFKVPSRCRVTSLIQCISIPLDGRKARNDGRLSVSGRRSSPDVHRSARRRHPKTPIRGIRRDRRFSSPDIDASTPHFGFVPRDRGIPTRRMQISDALSPPEETRGETSRVNRPSRQRRVSFSSVYFHPPSPSLWGSR